MYKVIIVDDESVIRESLANLVDWPSLGFEVAARFRDGQEAIDYITKAPVDVILTDIKMTFVSGLDVAKYVHENKLPIKVVLISGYKEFEFARQAISYNVVHYLLKPTRLSEINRIFKDIKLQLDKEDQEKRQYQELIPILQEQFLFDLVMGAIRDEKEIKRRIALLGMDISLGNRCCVISVKLSQFEQYLNSQWEYGKDNFYTAIRNILRGQQDNVNYFPIYDMQDNQSVIQVLAVSSVDTSEDLLRQGVERHFDAVKQSIEGLFGLKISIDIHRIYENIIEMVADNKSIMHAVDFKNTGNAQAMDVEAIDKFSEPYKLFMSYISAGNIEAVRNLFDGFMAEIGGMDVRTVRDFVVKLFAMLSNKLEEIGVNMYIASDRFNYDDILKSKNIEAMRRWGRAVLDDITAYMSRYREASDKKVIQQAKQFMMKNYYKDISLEDVADYVFLSPVYFSRFFKEQTSENFVDYLISIRMKKAMELLAKPQYKIYDVASMVGYKSAKYFSRLFKDYTGFTPSEYRHNFLEGSAKADE
ncbi:response regulator transcription factor [Mahella australiensis]|uniref:Stage 0 sporulation protein A homolog n=1 Tax=Mahella australiensis (strain DSM 15567 / CIP 107919 / 50-1 BON) TaxID=697281 RepID=F4A118_MAHA5|nr:response regulator [Mahella australiensis]AEE95921.1 two component transcriptional regulator, AraC family [Mahella australiensis 50-1 BON]